MLPNHPDFGLLGSSSTAPDEEPDKTKRLMAWKNVEVCTRFRVENVVQGCTRIHIHDIEIGHERGKSSHSQ
ncbi:hypothetical protein L1987_01589 [Smallanthus sonchifolius]|uniref:Uncharacterized protein n=1 Tax=Smallanthus sonchifolius TaxID=185202 RepID=A0ACB9K5G1_9ASTR|nr:hypothetical protein L1987_01589 [Smallanthus sonchifolius]